MLDFLDFLKIILQHGDTEDTEESLGSRRKISETPIFSPPCSQCLRGEIFMVV